MQECSNCGCDYIELRDGDRATSSIIGRYCSSTMPSKVISTGNQLYVKFVTDDLFMKCQIIAYIYYEKFIIWITQLIFFNPAAASGTLEVFL